jgi:hypothetical protein
MAAEPSGNAARNRRALLWGAPVIGLLVLYLLVHNSGSAPRSFADNEAAPDDVQAMRAPGEGPLTPATYAGGSPTAQAVPVTAVPAPVVAPSSMPAEASAESSQFRLYGILTRGAVIGTADGSQHFVPIGREVAPGVRLTGVDVHHAILSTPSGELRLSLDAAPAAALPPAQSQPAGNDTVVHLR